MKKIDPIIEPPKIVRDHLDGVYVGSLDNLDKKNPKIVVLFSGGNGVGKSTLAQKIKGDLNALVLENDKIKTHIKSMDIAKDRDELNRLTWQYATTLYERLGEFTENGLVVRDGVIDWQYDRLIPIFDRLGYKPFIVQFEVSREQNVELLKKRGDSDLYSVDRLANLLDEHELRQKEFRSSHKADVILKDEDLFNHQMVLYHLASTLESHD